MAHCPYEKLQDLEKALAEIRTWPGIREPKPGIFYLKSKPFLHFHIKDTARWADVRSDGDWEEINAPAPISVKQSKVLVKKIDEHFRRVCPKARSGPVGDKRSK